MVAILKISIFSYKLILTSNTNINIYIHVEAAVVPGAIFKADVSWKWEQYRNQVSRVCLSGHVLKNQDFSS